MEAKYVVSYSLITMLCCRHRIIATIVFDIKLLQKDIIFKIGVYVHVVRNVLREYAMYEITNA